MLLTLEELGLFFRLHRTLMHFVNQRLGVIPDRPADADAYSALPGEPRAKVHAALLQHMDLIGTFVDENPAQLPQEELDIVLSWRHLVHGKFYLFRELRNYTVFLSTAKPPVAYGVLALSQPFEEVVGPHLPILVETNLLPFKGRIVYDGLITSYPISFGPGIRRGINEDFKEAKARDGIVTTLPKSDAPVPEKRTRTSTTRPAPKGYSKDDTAAVLQTITDLTDQFCREHLNAEYAVLCRRLAEKLARKRPSPLLRGYPNTWASGIVRTVGWVNFLDDKTQIPHMKLPKIDAAFGVGESTGAAKSAAIRKMLKIHPLDPHWTLPGRLESNPMAWMIQVNGFMMDVRDAPRDVQEIALEKGLIPYIPADREQGE